MLGAGRCRSVGGRAGLGQPGRGARATPRPAWCGSHVDGGRVGGRLFESSTVPAALINVAFLASFLFFSAFLVFFKFSFSRYFPPFVFLSYHWCRWRPMYTKFSLYYTIFVIALRPLSSFLLFLTLLLNKIKCVLSFVSHVCFLSSGPLFFSLLPLTPSSH